MAQLAIKGHPTRGKEVIEILEMLGGKNTTNLHGECDNMIYIINSSYYGEIIYMLYRTDGYVVFTLEEFLKKYPYNVGDKVLYHETESYITSMKWDNRESDIVYVVKCKEDIWETWISYLQPYKEETMEETKKNLDWHPTDYLEFVDNDEWADEVELNLGNSYEIQVRDGQTFAIKKQPQYPKTCEECLKILGKTMNSLDNMRGYKYDLFMRLQQLLISREAYWKIAGEQMGLGKPWELSIGTPIYYIYYNRTYNIIKKDNADDIQGNIILAFPTAEMCDAFYENFNDLIEACKELL